MQAILKRLRGADLKIRKALNTLTRGEHYSLCKGSGLMFDDVRLYQYGDDVRSIHWLASSKGHGTYVKTFKEDREQTVFFLVDVSASQHVGAGGTQKLTLAREVCGTLMLSALYDASRVGMLCFSDAVEYVYQPKKGMQQLYRLLHALYHCQPRSKRTNLEAGLRKTMQLIRRPCLLIVISDFIDENDYLVPLKVAGRIHDLMVLHIKSPEEVRFPSLGIVPLYDPELNKLRSYNTSGKHFQKMMTTRLESRSATLSKQLLLQGSSYASFQSGEDFIPPLLKMLKQHKHRRMSR